MRYLYSIIVVRVQWELFAGASNIDNVGTNSLKEYDLLSYVLALLVENKVDRKVVASEIYGSWKAADACRRGAKGSVLKIRFASNAR